MDGSAGGPPPGERGERPAPSPDSVSYASAPPTRRRPTTIPTVHELHRSGTPIVMVTAYDATFARLLDDAGVDILLVGDSLGMVIQGLPDTLGVTLEHVIYHSQAVARGAKHAHIVADMPFMTYQVSPEDALRNAGRLLAEGRAHAVKLEGGQSVAPTIERLVAAGIPVMAHVGLTPQSVHALGGFRVQGRTDAQARRVLEDARAVADAGAYALVLEGIPGPLAEEVTAAVPIPTIGIGAGVGCGGQVLVCYDMLGMAPDFRPRFVRRYDEWFERGTRAVRAFCDDVRARRFPGPEHTFGARPGSS